MGFVGFFMSFHTCFHSHRRFFSTVAPRPGEEILSLKEWQSDLQADGFDARASLLENGHDGHGNDVIFPIEKWKFSIGMYVRVYQGVSGD